MICWRGARLDSRLATHFALQWIADLWYAFAMKDTIDHLAQAMPSATPTEDDIRKWDALPRDEQLRRLRAALTRPDCTTATPDTMNDILAEARARADSSRG